MFSQCFIAILQKKLLLDETPVLTQPNAWSLLTPLQKAELFEALWQTPIYFPQTSLEVYRSVAQEQSRMSPRAFASVVPFRLRFAPAPLGRRPRPPGNPAGSPGSPSAGPRPATGGGAKARDSSHTPQKKKTRAENWIPPGLGVGLVFWQIREVSRGSMGILSSRGVGQLDWMF